MSTRCQVKVIQTGLNWDQEITLYHHTDGYPSNMIPLIHKAYHYGETLQPDWYRPSWQFGRAGKCASYLCWADPGVFEPEAQNLLHGDIEYFYVIEARNSYTQPKPDWFVTVYESGDNWWDVEEHTLDDMKEIKTGHIDELNKMNWEEE